jgi:alkylated DNA nucleotide flippase Atl1
VKAKEGTFRDLLTQDRQFRVPLYQRHYRWNVEQQRDLWLDIVEQYEAVAKTGATVPRHFIGSIVAVALEPDPLRDFRHFRIVDGQQRMTTISVALAALRDVAAEQDETYFNRMNAKYLINATEEHGSDYWPRLVPGDEDAGAYFAVLTDPAHVDGHTTIGAAYRFFRTRIAEMRDRGELKVDRLSTTMGERLSLVFVTVEEGERPHKIFESINATGVNLSQADLLRNYLFMALASRSNLVYTQVWRPLEKLLGSDALEDLVRDDLQARGSFVKRGEVYRTHRAALEKVADDLDALDQRVRKLTRRGHYYSVLLRPSAPDGPVKDLGFTKLERSHLAFLRTWGATTTYPFLLHLYDQVHAGVASHEQARRCLSYIESFIVRRHLAAVPTNVLNRLFIQLIGALPPGEPIDAALRHELSRDGRWPSDDEVRAAVREQQFYMYGRGHQKKLVLQRIEDHLRAEVPVSFENSNLSIEHILPQTLNQEWKDHLIGLGLDPAEVILIWGHTLGNLTLTAWNSQLSNNFLQRKQEILADSELRLNDDLKEIEQWGPGEIRERADTLAEAAIAIWGPPIPGVVSPYSGFDWGVVDRAVSSIPTGRWTAYGDLANLAGTAAQPTANHIANSSNLLYAYRVLSSDGSISFDFRWHDPDDDRDPVEVLTAEGIEFDEQGRAAQEQRLTSAELVALAEAEDVEA